MIPLPHLAARLYDAPLLIHRSKLDVILAVLGERIGLPQAAIGNLPVPAQKTESPSVPGIAVIPVYGTLVRRTVGLEAESGLTSYQSLADALDQAVAEPDIAGILLDIDSPGGEAGGVFDLADRIRAACRRKKVYAVTNDSAYSAAYAIASSAEKVFVTRTGGIGSIGVIAMHVDQSVHDAQDGYCYTTVFAGAKKNALNPHEPITDAGLAFLQGEVNRIYGLFADTVAAQSPSHPGRGARHRSGTVLCPGRGQCRSGGCRRHFRRCRNGLGGSDFATLGIPGFRQRIRQFCSPNYFNCHLKGESHHGRTLP